MGQIDNILVSIAHLPVEIDKTPMNTERPILQNILQYLLFWKIQ
jgi:hypothetical protein